MIVRPSRELRNRPARTRMARWVERVLCGAPIVSAMTPAVTPIGSCFTSSRKMARRVGCASADRAEIACASVSELPRRDRIGVARDREHGFPHRNVLQPATSIPSFLAQRTGDKPERFDYWICRDVSTCGNLGVLTPVRQFQETSAPAGRRTDRLSRGNPPVGVLAYPRSSCHVALRSYGRCRPP